ncbi:prolyl oligopeptidase family serine peptidase [Treponema sp. TIM-1]|uniref:prolyl oligopeptidase family serine peptidase n=1 Tax=Treponema sp. TIM-1 TaxID=2898417 RepID=UPI003980FCF8
MIYHQVYTIMDWGPAVTKLILDLEKKLPALPIDAASFAVSVKRFDPRNTEAALIDEGSRKIKIIFVSDAQGNKTDSGTHITLELACGPADSLGSPMNSYKARNAWIDCHYRIVQKKRVADISDLIADKPGKTHKPQLEKFNFSGKIKYHDREYGEVPLTYADYIPPGAHEGSKLPLIIWLHGLGEGGTDASLPVSANKACHFASPEIQAYFGGEAYVLAPQAPTFWMDMVNLDPRDAGNETLNASKYTRALKNLFDHYIAANPGIDRQRIYIGGCSNGGFMTQVLIMAYPELFAAAFPVCSTAIDSRITHKQLLSIRHLPIWFVNAASDPVVPAPKNSLGTYDRLVKLEAPQVYYSYPRNIYDKSGLYTKKDGSPYVYPGHCSWIYVYNNWLTQYIHGKEISLMEWLASQRKK